MDKYSHIDYLKELETELKARERIWRSAGNLKGRFLDARHQKRYDTLKELVDILTYTGTPLFEKMRESAKSNRGVIQSSMFE